jgi:hypothetical protein
MFITVFTTDPHWSTLWATYFQVSLNITLPYTLRSKPHVFVSYLLYILNLLHACYMLKLTQTQTSQPQRRGINPQRDHMWLMRNNTSTALFLGRILQHFLLINISLMLLTCRLSRDRPCRTTHLNIFSLRRCGLTHAMTYRGADESLPDQEWNKLQREKILIFIYPI